MDFKLIIGPTGEALQIGSQVFGLEPLALAWEFTRWGELKKQVMVEHPNQVLERLLSAAEPLFGWVRSAYEQELGSPRSLEQVLGPPLDFLYRIEPLPPEAPWGEFSSFRNGLFYLGEAHDLLLAFIHWASDAWPWELGVPNASYAKALEAMMQLYKQNGYLTYSYNPSLEASFRRNYSHMVKEATAHALQNDGQPELGEAGETILKYLQGMHKAFLVRTQLVRIIPTFVQGKNGERAITYAYNSHSLLPLAWVELLWAIDHNIKVTLCLTCGGIFLPHGRRDQKTCSPECRRAWAVMRRGGPEAYRKYNREHRRASRQGLTRRHGVGSRSTAGGIEPGNPEPKERD